jgi:phosphocarrier protein HPr
MIKKTFLITSESGLHARPATALIHAVSTLKSEAQIQYKSRTVNLKSILGVMSLGVKAGAEVTIQVEGDDEEVAMLAIEEVMVKERLGE